MSVTILDGGMGQELVSRSGAKPTGLWATQIMMDRPELVRQIHDDYFAAGAEVATVNSYSTQRDRLEPEGLGNLFENLQKTACEIACRSRDAHGSGIVAGSLGPLGWSYSHDGAPSAERAAELYDEICRVQFDYVDVFLIETIASLEQANGALSGALGNGKPVWLGLTVDDHNGTCLRSGEQLQGIFGLIEEHPPQALILNCSVPEAISQGLGSIAGTGIQIGAYANGFTEISTEFLQKGSTVASLSSRTDLTPDAYADHAGHWIDLGAEIVGGCCEVGPAHIAELARRFGKRD
ncbi:MAG: homocysteine S-methyltransferase family protein [Rhizobiaceae bacterium]